MELNYLISEAIRFRHAIQSARDNGEFVPKPFHKERMNDFPVDCCDDATDLFIHYLYQKFKIDSIRICGSFYDHDCARKCFHVWQEVCGFTVDLTGDQFNNNNSILVKANAVYVGNMDMFHHQFIIEEKVHSCEIESLGSMSHDRMYSLYYKIMNYIQLS